MIVKSDFAYGDYFTIIIKLCYFCKLFVRGVFGFVSVDSNRSINKIVVFRKFYSCKTRFKVTTAVYYVAYTF